jgi:hypothetical protein
LTKSNTSPFSLRNEEKKENKKSLKVQMNDDKET